MRYKSILFMLMIMITTVCFSLGCASQSPSLDSAEVEVTDPIPEEPPEPEEMQPTVPASGILTYEEAAAFCAYWLGEHSDLTNYSLFPSQEETETPSEPTYKLFSDSYYEFFVSTGEDGDLMYSHYFLVNEKTGELLSLYRNEIDYAILNETVEPLDDWYEKTSAAVAERKLSEEAAIKKYEKWLKKNKSALGDLAPYKMSATSSGTKTILGEEYYFFCAMEDYMYWFNLLVNTETGELLSMTTSDGLNVETKVQTLDDWLASQ